MTRILNDTQGPEVWFPTCADADERLVKNQERREGKQFSSLPQSMVESPGTPGWKSGVPRHRCAPTAPHLMRQSPDYCQEDALTEPLMHGTSS